MRAVDVPVSSVPPEADVVAIGEAAVTVVVGGQPVLVIVED